MSARRQFPDGIEHEMTRVFVKHCDEVFRSALRAAHGDRMQAEDAMIDAFAEAAQTVWATFLVWDGEKQCAWLRRRAINRVTDSWRKTRKTTVAEAIPDLEIAVSVEDVALSRITVDRCWKVILSMEPRRQRAAYLHWHEGRSITEVAGILGVDRATTSRDLAAAVALLKRELGDELPLPATDLSSATSQRDREEGL